MMKKQVKARAQSPYKMWKGSCLPLRSGLAVKEFQAAMTYFSVLSFPSPTAAENTGPVLLE